MLSHHLKVGLAAIAAFCMLAWGVWYVSGSRLKQRETYPLTVVFDNVQGLEAEANVRLAGVNIGWVQEVNLLPNGRAALKLAVFKGTRIPRGSQFTIQVGVLQDKVLDIKLPAGELKKAKFHKSGDEIKQTVSPVTLDDLMADARGALRRVDTLVGAFDELLSNKRLKEDVMATTENIRKTTDETFQLARMLKETGVANRENIDVTIANVRHLTARLNISSEKINELMDNANNYLGDEQTRSDFKEIIQRLKKTMDNIEKTTDTLKDISTDDQVKDDLKQTIHKARETMDSAEVAFSGVSRFVKSWNATEVKPSLEFRYVGHEAKYHMDMNLRLYSPSKDIYYLLGLSDVGENSNTDLMVGMPGARRYWYRFGFKSGKLGLGFEREMPRSFIQGDLIDPNNLRFNLRVGRRISEKLFVMFGDEAVFKKDWFSIGVLQRY